MKHPVPRYSFLAFQLIALLDQGETIAMDDARQRIRDGTLLDWLEERYPFDSHGFELSPYDAGERRTILRVFGSLADNAEFAVSTNGLALCLAYCVQVMQSPEAFDDYRFDE